MIGRCTAVLLLLLAAAATEAERVEYNGTRRRLAASLDCRKIHRACKSCRTQRQPGTRKTVALCSVCENGWRVRKDGKSTTCDCNPGLTMNGTQAQANAWCNPCPRGLWCPGGDAKNPDANAKQCDSGLATIIPGAKSAAQCFTLPGFGRNARPGNNGMVVYSALLCSTGTFNVGGNTAGCQRCGPGLTTIDQGANSTSACIAPPGSYYDRGYAKACPKGTFSISYNTDPACTPCADGVTTAAENSTDPSDCDRAMPGYSFAVDTRTAVACELNTYSDQENSDPACKPCPFGWKTKDVGASGVAECLAPPGWELVSTATYNATQITECNIGHYKSDWNRNRCTACGEGLITADTGSVGKDACLVPAGWGIYNLFPLSARMCVQNTYGDNVDRPVSAAARCSTCSANMYTLDVLAGEVRTTGYTSESECKLAPGWGQTATLVEVCQVGNYNPGLNRLPCESCPNAYTTLGEAKTSIQDCVIKPGWELDRSLNLPRPCDRGEYSTGGTADNPGGQCVACSAGFTTQEQESDSPGDCNICVAGYGGDGCKACAYNTWSSGNILDGDSCNQCAQGTVSARGATSSIQCYPELQSADDVFQLSDDGKWTNDPSRNAGSCQYSCQLEPACIMYRWSESSGTCQVLLEDPLSYPAQQLAFKVLDGSDYAIYVVSDTFNVGMLLRSLSGTTLEACMAACSKSGACGLVSFPTTASPSDKGLCRLWSNELDAEWICFVHIQGAKLYSDRQT